MKRFSFLILIPVLFFPLQGESTGALLKKGDSIQPFSLADQRDRVHRIADDLEWILFSADKSSGRMIQRFLDRRGKDFLIQKRAAFIIDLQSVPSLIRSLFIYPGLEDLDYPVLLATEKWGAGYFPTEEGSATLIHLKSGRILEILFRKDEKGLDKAFGEDSME